MMGNFFENLLDGIDWKKAAIFTPILLIVIGLTGWYAYSTLGKEEELVVEETVALSEEESLAILTSANRFINSAGNFGFEYKLAVESNSILGAKKLAQASPQDESIFFVSRATAYLNTRDNIAQDSPIYYPTTQALSWSNDVEIGNLERLFRVKDVEFDIPKTVSKLDFKGAQYDMVTLDVNLDSNVSYAKQTATDSSWDGTVEIHSKDFNNETFELRMIKIGDTWKPYDIGNMENVFLLATWKSPELNYFYHELNDGFEVTDTLKANVPNIEPAPPAPHNPENEPNIETPEEAPMPAPAPVDPNAHPSVQGNIPAPGPEEVLPNE